jgi:hypothetical protein
MWGLAFLAVPGVAISLDRMMVDGPLVALAVGLMLQESTGEPGWQVYAILAAAPVIRETGFLLIAAWCAVRALASLTRQALYGLACAIPALAWFLYTGLHSPPDATPEATWPLGGLIRWTLYALGHPVEAYGPRASAVFEFVALAGIWLAFALAIRVAATLPRRLPELIVIAFALFACVIGYQDIWASAYGIGRTLSPLLIALAVIGLRDRRVLFALPLAMIVPRIALQFAAEIRVGLRG